MKVYFSLPITGSFIHKIITYSLWQFIYEVHLIQDNVRYKFVVKKFHLCTCLLVFKTSDEQKLNFLNWNLEIWVFFTRVIVDAKE